MLRQLFPGIQTLRPHDAFGVWRLEQLEKFVASQEKAKSLKKQKGKEKAAQEHEVQPQGKFLFLVIGFAS